MLSGEGATEPIPPWVLWKHQQEGVDDIEAAPERRIVACSPTGSGKTLLGMELARRAIRQDLRVMVMAPRHELIQQFKERMDTWAKGAYGIISAGFRHAQDLYRPLQLASVDTLVSRVVKRRSLVLPSADLVICDEVHLYQTAHRAGLLEMFPGARIIGLTATPGRYDGRPLGMTFERLIEIETMKGLIDKGYLVPPLYYAPSVPDLRRVQKVAGDYNRKQLEERMEPLLGDIIEHWLKLACTRRTVVFATTVGQSVYLAERFRATGVAAEHCDGTADQAHREGIFERFRSGETQVLCNVDLATYGFDLPDLSCVVLARPTLSVVRYLQMVGRGLRAADGKTDCLVLDHAGNVRRHGYAEEDRYWSLDGRRKGTGPKALALKPCKSGEPAKQTLHLRCPRCKLVFAGALTCPACQYYFERTAVSFRVVDGELIRMREPEPRDQADRIEFYRELLGYAGEKGYKPGWAAHAYESKYKALPPREWAREGAMVASPKTRGYVKFLTIRRAKARRPQQQGIV
jgi:superfamily II DNA or RNA helicase